MGSSTELAVPLCVQRTKKTPLFDASIVALGTWYEEKRKERKVGLKRSALLSSLHHTYPSIQVTTTELSWLAGWLTWQRDCVAQEKLFFCVWMFGKTCSFVGRFFAACFVHFFSVTLKMHFLPNQCISTGCFGHMLASHCFNEENELFSLFYFIYTPCPATYIFPRRELSIGTPCITIHIEIDHATKEFVKLHLQHLFFFFFFVFFFSFCEYSEVGFQFKKCFRPRSMKKKGSRVRSTGTYTIFQAEEKSTRGEAII